ncbi:transposase [Bacillus cereus]|uniref:Transposase n=1 Tax=Bacillus cereus TaxID=1396 RepID=A0A9X7HMY5_BACCE|nr:DUF6262 family protein [Bacillus cereus]PDY23800.1 transposase [Bacillus cereus]PFW17400.1 transposase [Bacillus cereus]PGX01187.1 transposase [Bacillus cereus]PHA13535.1 transposase [Bacillus cereus]PHG82300.1 transposase [Bacillus cereus]
MGKKVRNTEKIVCLAKLKTTQTRESVDKAISKLSLEGRIINFNTVAKEANVSKSWLYKETDIRKRIESLRKQQYNHLSTRPVTKKSSRSEEVLIKTLKMRIKEVEGENTKLKNQIQKLYGELYNKE